MIFETHTHLDDEAFDEDRDNIIRSFPENGIGKAVNIGANIESSKATVELTKKYDFIYGAVGVHPSDVSELSELEEKGRDGIKLIRDMVTANRKIVAIGEIGLDYHYEDTDKPCQKKWFIKQLALARECKLPVVIHSRDAAADTLEIMRQENAQEIGGVVHCYSYSKEIAGEFVDMGFYIGVGGVVTFKNGKKLKETVESIPLDKIVLETDSPYLAPEPFRGGRNSALNIPYIAQAISELKGVSVEEVYDATWENAHRLYGISM